MANSYAPDTFPADKDINGGANLPNTDQIIRQTDCSYSFGSEAATFNLKFLGDVKKVTKLAADYRAGLRVKVSTLTSDFSELKPLLGSLNLEASGKVTQSTATTKTGCAQANISVQIPYKDKVSTGSGGSADDPDKRVIVTWAEKSTNNEYDLGIYCGEGESASTRNAGEFEAWKNERTKNIDNYKNFKYTNADGEAVDLGSETRKVAEKWYKGVEVVMRAYPEVIRTTQYLNIRGDEDYVDKTLIGKIKSGNGIPDGITREPKLYYRDPTPEDIWSDLFPDFDWLKASFDVNTEATEYQKLWNMTVTESWIGCDINDQGTWDNDLYGPDRWPFATVNQSQPKTDPPTAANNSKRVKPNTFNNQSDLKTVDLGTDFYAVDDNSFRASSTRGGGLLRSAPPGAPALESIRMPSVSFIGDDAFNGAANLQSIVLSNQISFLGESVFKDCSSMTEAVIEPSIYSLPESTFEGCTSLDAPSGAPLTLGGLINAIGASAFKDCTSLTAIECENAITSIGANAFDGDVKLRFFSVPTDSTGSITLGDEAFKGCEKLADIELPVPTITLGTDTFDGAFDDEVTVKAPKSFLSNLPNTSSYNYIYPAFVTSIAQEEFRNDSQLKSVVIPSTITTLGSNSFRAPNLESAVFSASVTQSNTSIFQNCSNLQSLVVDSETLTTLNVNFALNCTSLTDVTITSPLTTLSNSINYTSGVFRGCSSLTDIDFLPETVEDIGGYAFGACSGLVTANLPPALTTLRSYAFNACTSLKSAILPENATGTLTLGDYVFSGCSALERVDLPVGTLTVGSNTFNNALASECWIKAPFNSNLVGSIPSGKSVNYIYPSFTTSIASAEWQNNTKLKTAAIPEAVTSIGSDAFDGCTNLTEITMTGKEIADVQAMTNYPFGLTTGQVIHCSDGDITIS